MNLLLPTFISLVVLLAPTTDEDAIRHLLRDREEAWEKQDVAHLIAPFADDADYIDSSGTLTTGRKAIEANYEKLFASMQYKDSRSTQTIKKIRFVRPDVAVVDSEWSIVGLKSADGKSVPDRFGTSVVIIVRESKEWKIVTLRAARSTPAVTKGR